MTDAPTENDLIAQAYRPPPPVMPPQRVTVTDIDMPFGSMVVFMVKWAIAAIPALLILVILGAIVSAVLSGVILGVGRAAMLASPNSRELADDLKRWHDDCDEYQGRTAFATADAPFVARCRDRKAVLDRRERGLE